MIRLPYLQPGKRARATECHPTFMTASNAEHSISDPHYFDLQGLCRLRSYIIVHSMVIMTQIRVAAMLITPGLLVRVGRFPGRPGRRPHGMDECVTAATERNHRRGDRMRG